MRNFLICNLVVEICVVGHDENLLDVVALYIGISIIGIVVADPNHTTHDGTDDKESIAVHTGHRVINDNDFVTGIGTFRGSFEASVCGSATNLTITANQLIEIQESVSSLKMPRLVITTPAETSSN